VAEDLDAVRGLVSPGQWQWYEQGQHPRRKTTPATRIGLIFFKCFMKMPREGPMNDMGEDEALSVKENKQHLSGSSTVLGLFPHLSSVVTDHQYDHSDDGGQHEERALMDGGDHSGQTSTCCCFCSSQRRFGAHLEDFFSKPKSSWRMTWVVETDVTWALATALMFSQRSSSTSAATEAVKARVIPFFAIQVPQVIGDFAIFSFLDYVLNCPFPESHFPVYTNYHLFYFLRAFSSPGKVSDEVPDIHTSTGW
jgi:hypothetical protein